MHSDILLREVNNLLVELTRFLTPSIIRALVAGYISPAPVIYWKANLDHTTPFYVACNA
jgi:hypothetical protein